MAGDPLQKPEKKAPQCCYCCIKPFSGFFLLMLVATVITLLRYFLEFAGPSLTSAGNSMETFISATTPHAPTRSGASAGEPLQASATDRTTSEQSLKRVSPETSPPWDGDPPRGPAGKPGPWGPAPRSPRLTLPTQRTSPWHHTPAVEEASSPTLSSAAEWPPTEPARPQPRPSASPRPGSAMRRTLPPRRTEATQPMAQLPATTANVAFPPCSAASAEPGSSPRSPAALPSLPGLAPAAGSAPPPTRCAATRQTSGPPASASPGLRFALPQPTAMQWASPSQGTSALGPGMQSQAMLRQRPSANRSGGLPRWATAMKWASLGQPDSAVPSRCLPQRSASTQHVSPRQATVATTPRFLPRPTSDVKLMSPSQAISARKGRFLPQLTTVMKQTSPQPASAIKLGSLPHRPTSVKWAPPSPLGSAIKSRVLPQPSAGINPTTAKASSLQNLAAASPWPTALPLDATYSQHPIWGQEMSSSRGRNDSHQYAEGSFQPMDESYHSSYSDDASPSGKRP